MTCVALLSTPWPLFNRPSIQLASLKAFVKEELPRVTVAVRHCYLTVARDLGYDRYGPISESTWLAEAPYAALLYPELRSETERFWNRRVRGTALGEGASFETLCRRLGKSSRGFLDGTDWRRHDVVGFSVCYGQLTSSLYFAREIRRRAPSTTIVFGGSACAGEMGASLLEVFPELDVVVRGEGERPLVHLIRSLQDGEDTPLAPFPGLLRRDEGGMRRPGTPSPPQKGPKPFFGSAPPEAPDPLPQFLGGGQGEGETPQEEAAETEGCQVPHLDDLPLPDFTDYFSELASFPPDKRFLPRVPMEISRGCWWREGRGASGTSGCAFCNLNLQWSGYRFKSRDRVVREVDLLSRTCQTLSISFMDNLLPPKGLEDLFGRVEALGRDFRLFSEIRATTPRAVLSAMGAAGMRQVQVGIEALSSRLLRKLNKGTTVMDNLEVMKHCETPGGPELIGNLILEFPSSDEGDVAETLRTLDFALSFRPLKGIPFWLGYGSAVWASPGAYGIRRLGNHPYYRFFFPEEIRRRLTLMIQGYRGGVAPSAVSGGR